jgi:hypothetical protein
MAPVVAEDGVEVVVRTTAFTTSMPSDKVRH